MYPILYGVALRDSAYKEEVLDIHWSHAGECSKAAL